MIINFYCNRISPIIESVIKILCFSVNIISTACSRTLFPSPVASKTTSNSVQLNMQGNFQGDEIYTEKRLLNKLSLIRFGSVQKSQWTSRVFRLLDGFCCNGMTQFRYFRSQAKDANNWINNILYLQCSATDIYIYIYRQMQNPWSWGITMYMIYTPGTPGERCYCRISFA